MSDHTLIRPSIGALGRSLMVAGAAAGATNATYHAIEGQWVGDRLNGYRAVEVAVLRLPGGGRKAWSPATAELAWASSLTLGVFSDRELAECVVLRLRLNAAEKERARQ